MIAETPRPPYYAVIFTSVRTATVEGYHDTAEEMLALAAQQEGYLGVESVRTDLGITVSYWKDLESIRKWKANSRHLVAQQKGKSIWYSRYRVRICCVENDYDFERLVGE